jgi:hypothetical protein
MRHFFKFEEVDASRFVKLFLDGMKQAAGLSKAGMAVFELVYRQLQEKPNSDEIALSWHLAKTLGLDIPERTYRHGLRQLLEREFLYESLVDGLYFVNIRYMFNGDRLTFIRGYKLKGSSAQAELPLDDGLAHLFGMISVHTEDDGLCMAIRFLEEIGNVAGNGFGARLQRDQPFKVLGAVLPVRNFAAKTV